MIAIDFETFYDSDYSLSKLTTEEYIRDPRFEVIGVSVSVDGAPAIWFSGSHHEIHLWLQQFDWASHAVVAHNAMFDLAILNWKFGIRPKFIVDTLSMARALVGVNQSCSLAALLELWGLGVKGGEVKQALGKRRTDFTPSDLQQYGAYCCNDTMTTMRLYEHMVPQIPTSEMALIDWTIRCFTEPTLVLDRPRVISALAQHREQKERLLAKAGVTLDEIRSDETLASLLTSCGVDPPRKISARTGKESWAFAKSDLAFTELADHDDPLVSTLVDARLGNKTSIMESRLQRLVDIAGRGTMPFPLMYYGANTTGRWSGTDKINLQNLPKDGDIRHAICAPAGYKLAVYDLSQIELRNNAWHSNEQSVLHHLRSGEDVYSHMATAIFGYCISKEMGKTTHVTERFVGKTAELGCGYGCGGDKFHTMLCQAARKFGIALKDDSEGFASNVVNVYRETHPLIVNFWKMCADAIEVIASGGATLIGPYLVRDQRVWLPNGLSLYYPNLRREKNDTGGWEWIYDRKFGRGHARTKLYGARLCENITQAVSRIIFSEGLLRIIPHYRVVGTVHDELIALIPIDHPDDQVKAFLHHCMTSPVSWCKDLPLAAEGKIGPTYGACK